MSGQQLPTRAPLSRRSFVLGGLGAAGAAALALGGACSPVPRTDGDAYIVQWSSFRQTILGLGYEIQSDSIGSGNIGREPGPIHSQKALGWTSQAPLVVTRPDDYVHPTVPRIFTVRELARFQGFPDDFEFQGKETTGSLRRRGEVPQYSQVGNAVSPFFAHAVGKMIADVLERGPAD